FSPQPQNFIMADHCRIRWIALRKISPCFSARTCGNKVQQESHEKDHPPSQERPYSPHWPNKRSACRRWVTIRSDWALADHLTDLAILTTIRTRPEVLPREILQATNVIQHLSTPSTGRRQRRPQSSIRHCAHPEPRPRGD